MLSSCLKQLLGLCVPAVSTGLVWGFHCQRLTGLQSASPVLFLPSTPRQQTRTNCKLQNDAQPLGTFTCRSELQLSPASGWPLGPSQGFLAVSRVTQGVVETEPERNIPWKTVINYSLCGFCRCFQWLSPSWIVGCTESVWNCSWSGSPGDAPELLGKVLA